jgi:hypothetical protein
MRNSGADLQQTIAANTSKGAFAAGLYGDSYHRRCPFAEHDHCQQPRQRRRTRRRIGFGFTIPGSNNLIMAIQNERGFPSTRARRPLLGPLQDNGGPTRTHALSPGSPAIDRGKSVQAFPSTNARFARVVGSKPDIGAVEFDRTASSATVQL